MTFVPKTAALAFVLGSTLALAACGGGAEEADEPAVTTAEGTAPGAAEPAATATDAAAPEAAATPDAAATDAAAAATPEPATTTAAAAAAPAAPAAAAVAARPPEFAVCAACHSTEPGKNGLGPTLAGVFGAKAGHIDDFNYSEAMESSGLTWNEGNLDRYLADPKGVIPGTKMAYPGLKDAAKRKAMVDYLKTL